MLAAEGHRGKGEGQPVACGPAACGGGGDGALRTWAPEGVESPSLWTGHSSASSMAGPPLWMCSYMEGGGGGGEEGRGGRRRRERGGEKEEEEGSGGEEEGEGGGEEGKRR